MVWRAAGVCTGSGRKLPVLAPMPHVAVRVDASSATPTRDIYIETKIQYFSNSSNASPSIALMPVFGVGEPCRVP